MSELLYSQYNNVFSIPDPTITIKYQKAFLGHPQANTLSDINITREELSHKTLLEALMNFQQYFSNNAARAWPTLSNCCIKLLWKQAKYQ